MIRLLFLIILQTSCYKTSYSRYECGPHGRFEYCIDDIPGCVIGCHCHPGYYFDTESKICEPNIKLTQNYRRNYVSEPNRIQILTQEYTEVREITSTAPNSVDAKIDEITKDADDLGDWLYNQFFKTIENQVINKTNGDEQFTRRIGNTTLVNKPQKRSRKLRKSSRKKKKKKAKRGNLKKKLLRITEDDSLFDSSSTDTSNDSSDSSSSSDSSNSAFESGTDARKVHGHKKLVILSKKPKPQLPSFIFLPNIDTPFYPPIGLPPPPSIPMYPIVPVPLIRPFGIVTTVNPGQEEKVESSPYSICTTAPSEKTTTTLATTTEVTTKAETTEANHPTDEAKKSLRLKELAKKMKNGTRKELLQILRKKMQVKTKPPALDYFMDYQEPETRSINLGIPKDISPPALIPSTVMDEDIPKDEVDFKYLSQLIHRPEAKMTNYTPSSNMQINRPLEKAPIKTYLPAQANTFVNTRRQFNAIDKFEDAFYANLGRQIASMIRKMDLEGQRQSNIELEKSNKKSSTLPLFFENIDSPRSYWERSVRSPMKNYTKELEYINKSNENLFNLENEVGKRVLSLRELENIISTMETTKSKFKKIHTENPLSSQNKSLNFNMLQHHHYNDYDTSNNTMKTTKNVSLENLKYKKLPLRRFQDSKDMLFNFVQGISTTEKSATTTNKTISMMDKNKDEIIVKYNLNNSKYKIHNSDIFRSNTSVLSQKYKWNKWAHASKPTILKSKLKYHWNPREGRFNFHYYFDNNNQYEYEKTLYPFVLPNVHKYKYMGKTATPSYFHHEMHHFDYFE